MFPRGLCSPRSKILGRFINDNCVAGSCAGGQFTRGPRKLYTIMTVVQISAILNPQTRAMGGSPCPIPEPFSYVLTIGPGGFDIKLRQAPDEARGLDLSVRTRPLYAIARTNNAARLMTPRNVQAQREARVRRIGDSRNVPSKVRTAVRGDVLRLDTATFDPASSRESS
ncbi:hypothetical protein PYCCODRAFT_1310397 [Trametes coccinea BRFM310]|uniref:Uncharacterized protein n=1 Tax=Trametes coccinea (strain BRFM310) TaxID=1353009 RepID=A0A1Y2I7P6_TRAC3|nr:hypothetical protein PYCCODRAFT_1310397 [Trametes coccinea BRFM310]